MAIDGLVSGLDTTSIIKQLMDVERAPQDALVNRKSTVSARLDAFGAIRAKLTSLTSAATALSRPADWQARSATSSSESAEVSATSTAAVGSLTFTVDALAAAHSLRSGSTVAATGDVIATGGTVEITTADGPQTVDVGGGTLSEVVSGINGAGIGVRAVAVNTGSGYRLQLTATSTGAAGTFGVTAGLDAGVGGMVVATTGADARLTIGSGPGAYQVTSSSNTFADLIDGVTVTARRVDTDPVTVTVAEDVEALVKKVQTLVDAVNAARSEVATRTAYDPASRRGASLAGDSTARRVAQDLSRAITDVVSASALKVPGLAGLSVDRNGKATFDAGKFRTAYAEDPDAVQRLFVQGATTTGSVTFDGGGTRSTEGTYDVVVVTPATSPSTTGLVGAFPQGSPAPITLRIGPTEVSYTPQPTDGATEAAAGLQAAVDAAGLDVTVTEDGGGIRIERAAVGSGARFSVAWDGVAFSEIRGGDAIGTVGGQDATGNGNTLTVPTSNATLGGMTVGIPGGTTGPVGSVTYVPGVAQRLATVVAAATDADNGYLSSAEEGARRRVADLDRSIAAYDIRLAARETRLRAQFSALETALGQLRSKSDWLAGQLGGLQANTNAGKS
jgi:flagellar hook-associated protein 2